MVLNRKIVFIDLFICEVEVKFILLDICKKYFGGWGFDVYLFYNYI